MKVFDKKGEYLKVIVCGGRDYKNKALVFFTLDKIKALNPEIKIVQGGATGADELAGHWATENKVPQLIYPANWKLYGNRAGPIRNSQMIDEECPDLVVCFRGGVGTANMKQTAIQKGIEVREIRDNDI